MNTSLSVTQCQFSYSPGAMSFSMTTMQVTQAGPFLADNFSMSLAGSPWAALMNPPGGDFCCPGNQMLGGSPLNQMMMMQGLMQRVMMGGLDPGAMLFMMGFLMGSQAGRSQAYPQFPPMFGPPQPPPPPPPQNSGLAEAYQPGASVALFDDFRDTAGRTTHGEETENVMMQAGLRDEDIQRYHCGEGGTSLRGLTDAQNPRQFHHEFNGFIEDSFTNLLDSTSDNMEQILDDPNSQIKVINQSMSASPARVTANLLRAGNKDPQLEARLKHELGLPPDCTREQYVQALADRVQNVSETSPRIQESRERYDDLSAEASERGINHVLAAGNNGVDAAQLRELGVDVPPSFFHNDLANDYTTSVGALNADGSAPAEFTAPESEISAVGEHVLTTADGRIQFVDGTSFSAPQVAAQMALMRRQNPFLTAQETEDIVVDTATPVAGDPASLGAGEMNPELALRVAEAS